MEYAERGNEYGILFIFCLLCEYMHLTCVRFHVIYRVNQAEYVIHILVVAPREYVNIHSTRRVGGCWATMKDRRPTKAESRGRIPEGRQISLHRETTINELVSNVNRKATAPFLTGATPSGALSDDHKML